MKKYFLFFLCLCSLKFTSAQPHLISVQFQIFEKRIIETYGDNTEKIEKAATQHVVNILRNNYPFFDFTESNAEDSLLISITTSGNTAAVFQFTLTGLNIQQVIDPFHLPFLELLDFTNGLPGTYMGFFEQLKQKFDEAMRNSDNKTDLITKILSRVPLTDDVFWVDSLFIWSIPISFEVSRIATDSKIKIKFLIIDPVADETWYYTSTVNHYFKDIEHMKQVYQLPDHYPDSSLRAKSIGSISQPDSGINVIKRTYLLKYIKAVQGITLEDPDK